MTTESRKARKKYIYFKSSNRDQNQHVKASQTLVLGNQSHTFTMCMFSNKLLFGNSGIQTDWFEGKMPGNFSLSLQNNTIMTLM